MPHTYTPLRYPGGKTQLSKFVQHTIEINHMVSPIYCEPFCGGAGVAIDLLLKRKVTSIILNDFDICIYSVWEAILNDTKKFLQKLNDTPVNINAWHEQHNIYEAGRASDKYSLDLAFATFFLNRTNMSGIITAGPIGGFAQSGNYKLDCRYNKEALKKKILDIASMRDRIRLYHMDAADLIRDILVYQDPARLFVFFDPPYYQQGKNLYKNAFNDEGHVALANAIREMNTFKWILTYDNHQRIQELYQDIPPMWYSLRYMANKKRNELELFLHSPETIVESYGKVFFDRHIPFAV
ncbi:DNA adenine methylase [Selenomonas sp. TAMA-11512]|uniref:DNA adenine methylase n=1 Tax=Selenomonas sp. TAMA-11512 TaxID=3095337 RepID=UPI003084EC80|nr:DNA adenine methylase [Selenomonas sp. TAMA-11512]